jgi:hypothetical protein
MVVIVIVVMVRAGSVGTGLGIERGIDLVNMAAKTFNHVLDHVVRADANAVAKQLNRQMTIAEMPRDPNQFAIVVGMNFEQRLRPRAHPDNTAALQRQPVAIPQPNRLGEIDQQFLTSLRGQNDPPAMAAVEINQDLINWVGPGPRGQDRNGAHQ